MASREDRWQKTITGPDGKPGKTRTARWGKGSRYRVHYVDPDGRQRSKSFDRAVEADRFKATVETDILRGTYIDPDAGRIKFSSYAEQAISTRTLDEGTRDLMRRRLAKNVYPVIGGKPLGQLARSPSLIQALIARLRKDMADSSAQVVMVYVSTVFNCAVADERITRNPCKARSVTLPRPAKRKIVPWTAGQVAAVRATLPGPCQAMVDAGAGLGLRYGEAVALSPDDVDWLRGVVHVRRQIHIVCDRLVFGPPKGRKERDVPLAQYVKLALAGSLRQFPAVAVTLPWRVPGGDPVTVPLIFTRSRGRAWMPERFNEHVWRPARRAAGIPDTRDNGFHALRHFFASTLLHNGESIKAVQAWLGHASARTTLDLYGHMMPGSEDRTRGIIDAALSAPDCPDVAREGGK